MADSKQNQRIQAAYFACLAMDDEPSVRNVAAMFKRITGKGIRGETVRVWLACKRDRDTVGIQPEHSPDTEPPHESRLWDTAGTQPVSPHVRAAKVSSDQNGALSSSPTAPHTADKPPRPLRLVGERQLADPVVIKAKEYAAALYPRYEAALAGLGRKAESKTWFWNANNRALKELAQIFELEQVVDAWEAECRRTGDVVYSMSRVFYALRNSRGSPAAAVTYEIPEASDLQ